MNTHTSTDIYYDNKFEKYLNRPMALMSVKYADYYRHYSVGVFDKDDNDDNFEDIEEIH